MNCPHCGGRIEIISAKPLPDLRQRELPLMVELRLPGPSKNIEFFLANQEEKVHARAPAHEHDHVHDLSTRLLSHDHEHALNAAGQDLLDQVEELVACENRTEHFRTTWILRIQDFPNQVFAAIGETRAAKREGKVRKSVGGVLNWHFERFREASRQRRKAI